MKYTRQQKEIKMEDLVDLCGYADQIDFLDDYGFDSIVPGICMNDNCDATYEYEPDQDRGWCDICETNTVVSALVLAGVI